MHPQRCGQIRLGFDAGRRNQSVKKNLKSNYIHAPTFAALLPAALVVFYKHPF
jgi:hypothetical protein